MGLTTLISSDGGRSASASPPASTQVRAAGTRFGRTSRLRVRRHANPRSLRDSAALLLARVLVLGVGIGLWQAAYSFTWFDRTVTSSPGAVASYLGSALGTSSLWGNLWATLLATLIAFGLAGVAGVAIGLALALLPWLERVLNPYLDALNAMPRIALAPIFVVAFGLTMVSKVALAFSIVVFIMITSTRAGVRSVDQDIVRLATVLGANRRQRFFKVLLPVAVPSIFGGLRLGVIYSLLGVVTSELIASRNGIGQLLEASASLFHTEAVYGLLIVLAVVATLINLLMARAERFFLRWQAPTQV